MYIPQLLLLQWLLEYSRTMRCNMFLAVVDVPLCQVLSLPGICLASFQLLSAHAY